MSVTYKKVLYKCFRSNNLNNSTIKRHIIDQKIYIRNQKSQQLQLIRKFSIEIFLCVKRVSMNQRIGRL